MNKHLGSSFEEFMLEDYKKLAERCEKLERALKLATGLIDDQIWRDIGEKEINEIMHDASELPVQNLSNPEDL